jgi:hypothetical protein
VSGFTQSTITHKWLNADLTAASGTVQFTLTKRMTNTGVSIAPSSSVIATLDGTGSISQSVTANTDAATVPADAQWRVDVRVAGAEEEPYTITVPPGPGTVDLGTLMPGAQQV